MPDPRLSAREILALVTDASTFTELPYPARDSRPDGPLAWQGYDASRARAVERTGETESVVCGTARVAGTQAVLIAFEFGFLGGSLGERTGDRLEAAHDYARAHRLPVVPLVATGGSRMQEGMLALTQLQRVARQSALTREAGLPQIAVLRDPTTGGGWATLGAGADVILALPGAQVGFAGSRVRPPDADPSAYTAEAQVAAGAVDAVVRAEELRETLGLWLRLLSGPTDRNAPQRGAGLYRYAAPPRGATSHHGAADATRPREALPDAAPQPEPPLPLAGAAQPLPATGWDAVQQARSPQRPRAEAYLSAYFTHRVAIRGDRCGGVDTEGMLCGFGEHAGRTVAYAAQTGTATRPAGYRTAARLVRLADRLGIPVLTLVDTPGAANDAEAERQGAGAAIAELFGAVAAARVPVTTLVIGEGGSGGALALAAAGNTWATPDSYFSVIAPELAAAILKRPPEEVEATADQLRIRPQDLVELGVIRGIVGPDRQPGPAEPGTSPSTVGNNEVRRGHTAHGGASGTMDGLMEFRTEDGARVVVEGVESETGARLVSRRGGPVQAARTFEAALDGVRAAAESALRVFRDGSLRPDTVELEFGVKLSAETGAVIAKGAAEGHLVVKLHWSPEPSRPAPEPARPASEPARPAPEPPQPAPAASGRS